MLYQHLEQLKATKTALLSDPQSAGQDEVNFAIAHINDAINLIAASAARFPAAPPPQDQALLTRVAELEQRLAAVNAEQPVPDPDTAPPQHIVPPTPPVQTVPDPTDFDVAQPPPKPDHLAESEMTSAEFQSTRSADLWPAKDGASGALPLADPDILAAEQAQASAVRGAGEPERNREGDGVIPEAG